MQRIFTDLTPVEAAKRVAAERFAWPGGYAMGIITADGGAICSACAERELELITDPDAMDDWKPESAYHVDADDDPEYDPDATRCSHCDRSIIDATDQ